MEALPTLYKKTSTGAIQTWRIDVEDSTLVATYGQLGGKLQVVRDTITVGKNVGRSNETTPQQQALAEAQSQWEKKCKRGYVLSASGAASGEVHEEFITGGVDPMLAQSFAKHGHKIVFPAFVQPKLDGHRCIAIIREGKATLWSRTRKPITGVPHIVRVLEASGLPDVILDGELYNHDYRDRFEELTSFIKRPDPKPGHEVVQYHVYDVVNDQPFSARYLTLVGLPSGGFDEAGEFVEGEGVDVVQTIEVDNEDEAREAFASFVDKGYEGAILRNASSKYVNKRSYDLQKMKEFDDAEFEIVGVEEGRGRLAGKGIFVCKTVDGSTFSVKMKGALDNLTDFLRNADSYTGKMLTVQYQGITNDSKVPRFPIGLRIREDA